MAVPGHPPAPIPTSLEDISLCFTPSLMTPSSDGSGNLDITLVNQETHPNRVLPCPLSVDMGLREIKLFPHLPWSKAWARDQGPAGYKQERWEQIWDVPKEEVHASSCFHAGGSEPDGH